jgi:Rrf2 family transcriptional regulator, nitric oxide-sensitive transcriptional repressor
MKLQIASQLAVYALLELAARPDRPVSVGEIGDKYNVSVHHLAKVMTVLGRAKLVRAARGVRGGYLFTGNTRRTTLLDVIQLFEDLGTANLDAHAPGQRTDEARALREVLHEIDDLAQATFGSITIATMLKLIGRRRTDKPGRVGRGVAERR